ncbi:MAG: hypothetical protein ACXV2H_04905 [Actinomycetes bacterium]
MASFSELLRAALRTTTAAVTEGSRRNAQAAICARTQDAEAAARLLSSLAPSSAPVPYSRSA